MLNGAEGKIEEFKSFINCIFIHYLFICLLFFSFVYFLLFYIYFISIALYPSVILTQESYMELYYDRFSDFASNLGYSYSKVTPVDILNDYPVGIISENPFNVLFDKPRVLDFQRGFIEIKINDIHYIVYIDIYYLLFIIF